MSSKTFQIAMGTVVLLITIPIIKCHQENQYQITTPPAIQAFHKKLAQNLHGLPPGTFLRQRDGSLFWLSPDPDAKEEKVVYMCSRPGDCGQKEDTTTLARNNDHLILPDTPEWEKAAREFLIPKPTSTRTPETE